MKNTIKFAWKSIQSECERFQEKDPTIKFNEDKFEIFDKLFRQKYQNIMDRFMKDTTELDAHKQAALITICCLQAKIIEQVVEDGKISIAPELVAINVGLSYMNDRLNERLQKRHLNQIGEYIFPVPIACETPYIEVMSRILYYEQHEEDMSFNVMELSDRYFLIEYINLIQHGVEPLMLKE